MLKTSLISAVLFYYAFLSKFLKILMIYLVQYSYLLCTVFLIASIVKAMEINRAKISSDDLKLRRKIILFLI